MTREHDRIQKNANKYIVKNCPSCYYIYSDKEYECNFRGSGIIKPCQDCTDCVIKQVIEECKWETNIDVNDRGDLAERILSSLDIEEIK